MYIGIDIGTSSVKVVLVDKKGIIVKTIQEEYDVDMPQDNWAQQDPTIWWKHTLSCLKMVMSYLRGEQLEGISFSGQMHGLVILDEHDEIIRPAILWCDQRTQEECDYLNQEIGIERLLSYVGNQALTGFTAPKLLWLKKHEPDNFKRIRKIMLPKDYIQYKLTGIFASDYSDASGTLLLDIEHKCWSNEMMEVIGIQLEQLPPLYESYQKTGYVKESLMQELKIQGKVAVAAGAGDQAAGATGVGVVENGVLSIALGTSGVVFLPCESYRVDHHARLHSFVHANGLYHQMGVMLSAAGALKWWIESVNNTKDYDTCIEMEAKRENDVFFLPYLIGERTPIHDPSARGCFIGLNLKHTRGDMTRAVLEGITFALLDSFEIIKEMKQPIHEIRISGGGSKSELWKQMIADAFQLHVKTIETEQGPAYGAAILASCMVKGVSVQQQCNEWITIAHTYAPDKQNAKYYYEKYNIYKTLYPALKSIFKETYS